MSEIDRDPIVPVYRRPWWVGAAILLMGVVWLRGASAIHSTTNVIGIGPSVMVEASGALLVAQNPTRSTNKVSVAMVPEKRTHRSTSQRITQSPAPVLGLVSRDSNKPAPVVTIFCPGAMPAPPGTK